MGLFDRLSRVVRSNLNDLVSKAEDPEKILEQAVTDMNEDLIQLRQAVARAIAEQRQTEQRFGKEQTEAGKWEQRAKLALSKGDENLAREALKRKKTYSETATILKQQFDQQTVLVDNLRKNLIALESKISEAKTKKNMLQARSKAARANEELQKTLGNIDTGGSMAAFERMEEKVMQLEARSQAYGEIGGTGLDQQFAQLEAGGDVEDELAMLKVQVAGAPTPEALPASSTSQSSPTPSDTVVDAELEELRSKLNEM